VPGGPHGDFGAPFAVAGDFGQAEPPVERLCAAIDRQHIENQVLPGGDDLPPVRVKARS
jgi:hypothetical protein